jgi:uncharacterized UPF0160 family protein
MRVATHDGTFHADDVFALGALSLLDEPLEIVRTRDREAQAAADLRVDVGFANDPDTGDFDHHQKGGAGARPNGVRYASFGLIWARYGEQLCGGDAEAAGYVDQVVVQGIDANDNGQNLTEPLIEGVRSMSVSDTVAGMNARWDEDLDADEERARFDAAVAFAAGVLEREIASAVAGRGAARLVAAAIEAATDPRIIELSQNVPWKQVVVNNAPDALFVIYPKRKGWGIEAVPRELGKFENRRDLPEAWAGLDGPELAALTGVADALFCHGKRFLAVAKSREGIEELARQALAEVPA